MRGATIKSGAIVAADSVVSRDAPDYDVVAGNPAKLVKTIGADRDFPESKSSIAGRELVSPIFRFGKWHIARGCICGPP